MFIFMMRFQFLDLFCQHENFAFSNKQRGCKFSLWASEIGRLQRNWNCLSSLWPKALHSILKYVFQECTQDFSGLLINRAIQVKNFSIYNSLYAIICMSIAFQWNFYQKFSENPGKFYIFKSHRFSITFSIRRADMLQLPWLMDFKLLMYQSWVVF